jgi:hypothetical protein
MLRDRAYAYKLLGRWPQSIADLTEALTHGPEGRGDRAYAELRVGDVDAALADYRQLNPPPADLTRILDLIRPTQSPYVFLYLPVGAVNGRAVMPDEILRLPARWSRINLRFWWHPIAENEVRYTREADADEAAALVLALKMEGLTVRGPVRLSDAVERTRRIEMWLVTRKSPLNSSTERRASGR